MRNQKLLILDETEDLSRQVERVTAVLRPRPIVTWCPSFDAFAGLTAEAGPFDVLVAGPIAKQDGFKPLRQLRDEAPQARLILAFDHWRSSDLRDTVRAGALDILRLPVKDDTLLSAIEQAIEAGPIVTPGRDDNEVSGNSADSPGTVITVMSASGGSGKTFLATNLAYHLQSVAKKQTCVIDLDLQFGEMSTALRLKPRHTIYDLISAEGEGDEMGRQLEAHLERHESGIRVLSAPEDPAQADAIDASDVARVIKAARSRFDCVVLDTPTALSEPVLVALDQADQIFVLATLDLPSVRNLGVMMSTFKKLKVPSEKISLLLNKVEPDVGIDVARVEQYFPQGFSMVIPYGREVNRSLNMGQPLLVYAPHREVGKTLTAGLATILEIKAEDGAEVPDLKRRRRLHRPHGKTA